jgi:hypothetical protein
MVFSMIHHGRKWSYSSSLFKRLRNTINITVFMTDDFLLLDYVNESIVPA